MPSIIPVCRHGLAAALLLIGLPMPAMAAVAPAPTFVGELLSIVLPLAFVIIGLLVVLRVVRRRYGLTGQDAPLSVVQILPVGPRERVVVLKTRAGRVLAIGVSAQAVNLITPLQADDIAPAAGDTPPPGEPSQTVDRPRSRLDTLLRR